MRRNLYELLSEMEFDVYREYSTLMKLFREEKFWSPYGGNRSVEDYIDEKWFRTLSFRGTFISLLDLLDEFDLNGISDNLDDLLLFCEILIGIFHENNINYSGVPDNIKNQMRTILLNIDTILEKANYEAVELPDNKKRKVIVSKNPAAVLAAEIVEDTATATNIFEYNHFAIKGYLEGKRRILNAIAAYVEPMLKVKELKDTAYKTLESELGFLLNKFHVRHNNKEGANAQEYIVSLNDSQLEEWYDKIYTTAIMYILARENVPVHQELDELKKKYVWKN